MEFEKLATFGGRIRFKKENAWMYGLENNNPNLSKEKLHGARGPLHPGMPIKHQIAAGASHSDKRQTLISELMSQSEFTRREAENTVDEMLADGTLVEVNHPRLGKVLVFRG